jgi:ribosomal protein L33
MYAKYKARKNAKHMAHRLIIAKYARSNAERYVRWCGSIEVIS